MPIIGLLLGVFQGPIELYIANPGNLGISFILVVEAQKIGELDDLIPDTFGELDHFLLSEVNIFNTDASMPV